ncbi:MAG: DUF177 domain-containing protein [Sphingomonadales bacterium]|jgi:hypothetical protein|nr:DUF177 domain-containing protein [Sphingomonadales bacterium]
MTQPEFSRLLRHDRTSEKPQPLHLKANAQERAALVQRFGLLALGRLEADLRCWRDGQDLRMEGEVRASLSQACVVSGQPVPAQLKEPVAVRFSRHPDKEGDEIELDAEDCDTLPYDGLSADAGEAVAQTLALALNPFPRAPDAETTLKQAGVIGEDEAGAFGALAGLRDQLARK